MDATDNLGLLIGDLSADLKPVRRLWKPTIRAGIWLAVVLGVAVYAYLTGTRLRLGVADTPDDFVLLGIAASALTAALAGLAAFQLSLPDRSGAWALLPIPALVLWLAVTGIGCLQSLGTPGVWGATWDEALACLKYIAKMSLPVSVILVLMLRRARPLRPFAVASMAGLAAAGAAASLLILVHAHQSTGLDLLSHFTAVGLVVAINAAIGGRLLGTGAFRRPQTGPAA